MVAGSRFEKVVKRRHPAVEIYFCYATRRAARKHIQALLGSGKGRFQFLVWLCRVLDGIEEFFCRLTNRPDDAFFLDYGFGSTKAD
jgi:hypothetical protein